MYIGNLGKEGIHMSDFEILYIVLMILSIVAFAITFVNTLLK